MHCKGFTLKRATQLGLPLIFAGSATSFPPECVSLGFVWSLLLRGSLGVSQELVWVLIKDFMELIGVCQGMVGCLSSRRPNQAFPLSIRTQVCFLWWFCLEVYCCGFHWVFVRDYLGILQRFFGSLLGICYDMMCVLSS